ncbi:MAG: hypothetical protein CMJ75_22035 [Planctomycetaceae bacterium]|nr:hypothetical protein [Planctomycetaceae bacterium]
MDAAASVHLLERGADSVKTLLLITCLFWEQGDSALQERVSGERVRELVRQLNATQRAQRQNAERTLVKLGPEILRHLPEADRRLPAETQVRLKRIVKELERLLTVRSSAASLVTLQGRMPLTEAWASLEKQTGNRMVDSLGQDIEIDVDYQRLPFWQVLDRMLDEAGLGVDPYAGNRRALTTQRRAADGPRRFGMAAYAGLFRLEATRLQSVRELRNPGSNHLQVVLEVAWEPRLTPLSLSLPLTEVEARFESGERSNLPLKGVRFARPIPDMSSVELDLPMPLPSRAEKKIASLTGEIVALVPGRFTTFEFADLRASRGKSQTRAGIRVTYDDLLKSNDSGVVEVRIHLRLEQPNQALESHRGWVHRNEIALLDAQGNKAEFVSSEEYLQGRSEAGIGYFFVVKGDVSSYQLIYRAPALMIPVRLPFELKNLPLP